MRVILAVSLVAASRGQWALHLLDATEYPLAQCLDGSQGGFYFSPGSGSGASSWVIHTQGGGWCVSDADCAGRAKSALGSSSGWAPSGCDATTDKTAPVCYADGGESGKDWVAAGTPPGAALAPSSPRAAARCTIQE